MHGFSFAIFDRRNTAEYERVLQLTRFPASMIRNNITPTRSGGFMGVTGHIAGHVLLGSMYPGLPRSMVWQFQSYVMRHFQDVSLDDLKVLGLIAQDVLVTQSYFNDPRVFCVKHGFFDIRFSIGHRPVTNQDEAFDTLAAIIECPPANYADAYPESFKSIISVAPSLAELDRHKPKIRRGIFGIAPGGVGPLNPFQEAVVGKDAILNMVLSTPPSRAERPAKIPETMRCVCGSCNPLAKDNWKGLAEMYPAISDFAAFLNEKCPETPVKETMLEALMADKVIMPTQGYGAGMVFFRGRASLHGVHFKNDGARRLDCSNFPIEQLASRDWIEVENVKMADLEATIPTILDLSDGPSFSDRLLRGLYKDGVLGPWRDKCYVFQDIETVYGRTVYNLPWATIVLNDTFKPEETDEHFGQYPDMVARVQMNIEEDDPAKQFTFYIPWHAQLLAFLFVMGVGRED